MDDRDIAAHRFQDLLCARLADAIRTDPTLLDAARDVLDGPVYRSDYADEWVRLIDAGPSACTAVLESDHPDMRPLKSDNPFAHLGLIPEDERHALIARVRGARQTSDRPLD